jgi:Fe-S-cluster containining protein
MPEIAHLNRGDGVCRHLRGEPGERHTCAIYESRPRECRVADLRPKNLGVATWFALNEGACKQLHLRVYGTEVES